MDSSIVFNYQAKLQERVNNVNARASYLHANSLHTFNIKEDSNRRQLPPTNPSLKKTRTATECCPITSVASCSPPKTKMM
eukprot:14208672-Ditylum_brightwellii.AAC.1